MLNHLRIQLLEYKQSGTPCTSPYNKHCTFLHYNPVSVDWLYCIGKWTQVWFGNNFSSLPFLLVLYTHHILNFPFIISPPKFPLPAFSSQNFPLTPFSSHSFSLTSFSLHNFFLTSSPLSFSLTAFTHSSLPLTQFSLQFHPHHLLFSVSPHSFLPSLSSSPASPMHFPSQYLFFSFSLKVSPLFVPLQHIFPFHHFFSSRFPLDFLLSQFPPNYLLPSRFPFTTFSPHTFPSGPLFLTVCPYWLIPSVSSPRIPPHHLSPHCFPLTTFYYHSFSSTFCLQFPLSAFWHSSTFIALSPHKCPPHCLPF